MESSKNKTNFKEVMRSVMGILKEKIIKEINTISISVIMALMVALLVCMPAKEFMFKEHEVVFGIAHKTLLNMQYKVIPVLMVLIPCFIVGYIFNKGFISKIQFLKKESPENSLSFLDYLFRIVIVGVILIIVIKFFVSPNVLDKIANEEKMMKYLYKDGIILGVILVILSSNLVFYDIHCLYVDTICKKKTEELNERYILKFQNLNKKYTTLVEKLINKSTFTYDNSEMIEFLEKENEKENDFDNDKEENFNLLLEKSGDVLKYKKTKDFIKYGTNEDKYFKFSNQKVFMEKRYNSLEEGEVQKYFDDFLMPDLCNQILSRVTYISNNYLNTTNESELGSYVSILKTDLKNLTDLNRDVKLYINNRLRYLKNSYSSAEKGYNGELRVEKELDKYKDYIINIPNKCFNFKYIDFIPEDYTMECDNILITQKGIFVIETKNNKEDSIYVDERTGKIRNKCVLHIESDGRWVYKDESKNSDWYKVLKKTPVEQNRDHVLKLQKIINHHLGYDRFNDNYIEIKGVIVMANNNLKIQNDLSDSIDVCRPDSIFETIMKYPKNPLFTEEMIERVKSIINSYKEDIHKPVLYDFIDVNKELEDLEYKLKNILSSKEYYVKLGDTLNGYYEEYQVIEKEFSSQWKDIQKDLQSIEKYKKIIDKFIGEIK